MAFLGYINRNFWHINVLRGHADFFVDADVHALAVLQVHSIWGLALALFANPKGGRQIKAALAQIGAMLEALRVKNQG